QGLCRGSCQYQESFTRSAGGAGIPARRPRSYLSPISGNISFCQSKQRRQRRQRMIRLAGFFVVCAGLGLAALVIAQEPGGLRPLRPLDASPKKGDLKPPKPLEQE